MSRMQYQIRNIRWHSNLSIEGWDLKCYTISIHPAFQATHLFNTATLHLEQWLTTFTQVGAIPECLGFIILHEAKDGYYLLFGDWINEHILRQFTWYKKSPEADFELISDKGWIHCTWELAVVAFEREAYVAAVLKEQSAAVECHHQYLHLQLNAEL